MIQEVNGNLLRANVDALVNPVNVVGVMGKGLALSFKEAYPYNYKQYVKACRAHEVAPGRPFVVDLGMFAHPRWIVNFPTKRHWRDLSKMEDIEAGLRALKEIFSELEIKSAAMPALGCGLGGLDWAEVRAAIKEQLADADAEILLYSPKA